MSNRPAVEILVWLSYLIVSYRIGDKESVEAEVADNGQWKKLSGVRGRKFAVSRKRFTVTGIKSQSKLFGKSREM